MLHYLLLPTYFTYLTTGWYGGCGQRGHYHGRVRSLPVQHDAHRLGHPSRGGAGQAQTLTLTLILTLTLTLVEVGLGRLEVADVASLLATQDRGSLQEKGGPRVYKAPARGLCLGRCFYPGDDDEHDQAWPAQAMPSSEVGDGGGAAAAWSTAVAAGCSSTANTACPDDSRHQIKN